MAFGTAEALQKSLIFVPKKQMSLVSMAGRPWLDWPTLKEALHLGLLFLER